MSLSLSGQTLQAAVTGGTVTIGGAIRPTPASNAPENVYQVVGIGQLQGNFGPQTVIFTARGPSFLAVNCTLVT